MKRIFIVLAMLAAFILANVTPASAICWSNNCQRGCSLGNGAGHSDCYDFVGPDGYIYCVLSGNCGITQYCEACESASLAVEKLATSRPDLLGLIPTLRSLALKYPKGFTLSWSNGGTTEGVTIENGASFIIGESGSWGRIKTIYR